MKDEDQLVESIEMPLTEIPVGLSLYDSLRDDYKDFNQWYERVAKQGRTAYVIRTASGIAAIAIIKEEREGEKVISAGESLPDNFLKICTFKVVDGGFRYGESLLLRLFIYAKRKKFSSLYVQVRADRHATLIEFLEDFGFSHLGAYQEDQTYVKYLSPKKDKRCDSTVGPVAFFRKYYPSFDDSASVRKFIVSVSSTVHNHIFPAPESGILDFRQPMQHVWAEVNAIRKIIIENVGCKSLRAGDLLFFYRKSRIAAGRYVRCVGVVEGVEVCRSLGEVSKSVRERLTYTDEEILDLISKNRYVILISFRMLPSFEMPISKRRLSTAGIETNHRNVRLLPEELYVKVFKPLFWYNN